MSSWAHHVNLGIKANVHLQSASGWILIQMVKENVLRKQLSA